MLQILYLLALFFPSTYQMPKEGSQLRFNKGTEQPSIQEKILYPTMIAHDVGMRKKVPAEVLLLISQYIYGVKFKPLYQKKHLFAGLPMPVIDLEGKGPEVTLLFWYAEETGGCLDIIPYTHLYECISRLENYKDEAIAIDKEFLWLEHQLTIEKDTIDFISLFYFYAVNNDNQSDICDTCDTQFVLSDITNLYFCTKGWGTKEQVEQMCEEEEEIYYFLQGTYDMGKLYTQQDYFLPLNKKEDINKILITSLSKRNNECVLYRLESQRKKDLTQTHDPITYKKLASRICVVSVLIGLIGGAALIFQIRG